MGAGIPTARHRLGRDPRGRSRREILHLRATANLRQPARLHGRPGSQVLVYRCQQHESGCRVGDANASAGLAADHQYRPQIHRLSTCRQEASAIRASRSGVIDRMACQLRPGLGSVPAASQGEAPVGAAFHLWIGR